jgi:SAM-dependent methyltransferase
MKCIVCGSEYKHFYDDFGKCEGCGLFKNMKYPQEEELKMKLSNFLLTASRKKEVEKRRLGKAQIQIDELNKVHNSKGKLFDVAAAGGFFMKTAQDDGWIVDGNEISKASIEWAKSNYDLNIQYGYFVDLDLPNDYDAVVSWNSLEHTHYPIHSIMKAYNVLKPDGLFYIRVPNRNPNNFKNYLERFHAYEFNPVNLDRLLIENGFEQIFLKHDTDDSEAMDLMYKKI